MRSHLITARGRSRSTLGLTAEEALASTMMRAEGMSGGRDVGVVINRPNRDGPCLLPACGGVGTQYTPATGWAQALVYRGARVEGSGSRGLHRSCARRRGLDVDQRILGLAQHRDDGTVAAPLFHRGQRLRHLGPVLAADARRQHRGEPRCLRQPEGPLGGRLGSARCRRAHRGSPSMQCAPARARCCCAFASRGSPATPARTRRPTSSPGRSKPSVPAILS